VRDPATIQHLLRSINALAYERGGWAPIRNSPGGRDVIWEMQQSGYLEEDQDYVRLTDTGLAFIKESNPMTKRRKKTHTGARTKAKRITAQIRKLKQQRRKLYR
jgi:hypothetical protein